MQLPASDPRRAAATLAIDAFTARVVEALRRRGVRPLLLRGPAIVRWLYEPGAERGYLDIDILVPPAAFDVAEEVLGELGYTRTPLEPEVEGDRPRHANTWIRGDNGVMVDLHRTLAGVNAPPGELWNELGRDTDWIRLSTADVEVPAPPGRALVVVLNAAQHGLRARQSLTDLRLALAALPHSTWREAAALARRLDAEEAFASGLALAPAGERLAEELGLVARRSVATALRAQSAPEMALAFDWLVREAGLRDGLRLVVRKAAPSVDFMRAWSPLARRGRLGLATAYAWRPLWLVAQSVPALRAWLRARRAAR